jgi:hypothetical protein
MSDNSPCRTLPRTSDPTSVTLKPVDHLEFIALCEGMPTTAPLPTTAPRGDDQTPAPPVKVRVKGLRRPWRAAPNQSFRVRRTYQNTRATNQGTELGRGVAWLIPWDRANYPSLYRGVCTLLGRVIGHTTLWAWRTGQARCRPDVALIVAAEIERRCSEGMQIASDLRAYADAYRPFDRRGIGFLKVDPETGQNKRWRG